ncbi:ubiquinone biosynthesis monooxygenase Coq7 [Cryptococcus wingfieldii CBS 7118]|uniref:5-demethoxyubiquinone hydroxylase, mitochondrial n=1 Tax=Cryptococcus wingfieldii CBS 7118 TaxID=1295528 RepID=A0A1E3J6U0_9TREE|nr:ubiquinone biosynthesis monooxygenase Coq7 [Cryptococcus wingfieldii CBS 7118]ODN96395.1 ubiquinone biosynthesis monooxygenase Coq7 [Cryptococcus wingfieldii CBS 7118]
MSIVRPLCVPKILKPRASPYRTLSSDAYSPPPRAPPSTSTSNNQSQYPPEATTTTPLLTPEQDDLLKSILRVDHAGELGANWIYRGQKWAMDVKGDTETSRQVEGMWDNERHHLKTLSLLVAQHRARPTLLYPIWQTMAFALGAGTGLMSKEAAMACTEAVETVIGEHYDDQLRELAPLLEKATATGEAPHPSIPLMTSILREFRDDELEHLDTAVEEGAQKAPGHSLLSAIIGVGCKAAINVCGKI